MAKTEHPKEPGEVTGNSDLRDKDGKPIPNKNFDGDVPFTDSVPESMRPHYDELTRKHKKD